MPMSSREVMIAAIRFQRPDRLPVMIEALGVNDCTMIEPEAPSKRWQLTGEGAGTDEYGCVWSMPEGDVHNMGQVTGHPIADLGMIGDYPLPDWRQASHYEHMDKVAAEAYEAGRYVRSGHFMLLFERMHSLCGFSQVLEGLYLEPEAMGRLADRLVENVIQKVEFMGERYGSRIQGFGCSEDWGTQNALMISPEKWREFFRPRYKRIFDAVHAQGWDMWMHSCGKINVILPDLHEVGLDVINLQQPRALGIEEVGGLVGGKLCFEGLADIQRTLPSGDASKIEADVVDLLRHWARPEGGFIVTDYGDGAAISARPEAKRIMLDMFMKHDPYRGR